MDRNTPQDLVVAERANAMTTMTIYEISALLKLSTRTIYRYRASGALPEPVAVDPDTHCNLYDQAEVIAAAVELDIYDEIADKPIGMRYRSDWTHQPRARCSANHNLAEVGVYVSTGRCAQCERDRSRAYRARQRQQRAEAAA